jgi:hypothetical protein
MEEIISSVTDESIMNGRLIQLELIKIATEAINLAFGITDKTKGTEAILTNENFVNEVRDALDLLNDELENLKVPHIETFKLLAKIEIYGNYYFRGFISEKSMYEMLIESELLFPFDNNNELYGEEARKRRRREKITREKISNMKEKAMFEQHKDMFDIFLSTIEIYQSTPFFESGVFEINKNKKGMLLANFTRSMAGVYRPDEISSNEAIQSKAVFSLLQSTDIVIGCLIHVMPTPVIITGKKS